jgi:hypothetical protein
LQRQTAQKNAQLAPHFMRALCPSWTKRNNYMEPKVLDIEQYMKEFKEWKDFFNLNVTLFLIATGFASINLIMHFEAGLFTLLFLCAYTHSSGKYPKLMAFLRNHKGNKHHDELMNALKEDYGVRASFTDFLPFTISVLFFVSAMLGYWC